MPTALHANELTGPVHIEDREVLIVDLEKTVAEILPTTAVRPVGTAANDPDLQSRRARVRVLLAEDSTLIRALLLEALTVGGYQGVTTFENGQTALEAIRAVRDQARVTGGRVTDAVGVLVTDIEMPLLDRLTQCRHIKEDPAPAEIPVVVFFLQGQRAKECQVPWRACRSCHLQTPDRGARRGSGPALPDHAPRLLPSPPDPFPGRANPVRWGTCGV